MAIYREHLQRVRFSSPDGYEKFKFALRQRGSKKSIGRPSQGFCTYLVGSSTGSVLVQRGDQPLDRF